MVDLVAEAAGHDALSLRLKGLTAAVLRPDPDLHGPLHHAPHPGDAEAALQAVLDRFGAGDDLRVYQL